MSSAPIVRECTLCGETKRCHGRRCSKCQERRKEKRPRICGGCGKNHVAKRSRCDACKKRNRTDAAWAKALLARCGKHRRVRGGKTYVRDIEVTLTPEWVLERLAQQGWRCAVTGVSIQRNDDGSGSAYTEPHLIDSPSLDRIKHTEGYTPENTRVVAFQFNRARGRLSDAEFAEMCRGFLAWWEGQ